MSGTGEGDSQALAELRARIDAIDGEIHRLLMQRGAVIDSLDPHQGDEPPGRGVPAGTRGRYDAPPGRTPWRGAAARHRRAHLARDHHHLHPHAGALRRRHRHIGGAGRDARPCPFLFRLLGRRRADRRSGGGDRPCRRDERPRPHRARPAGPGRGVVARLDRGVGAADHGSAALHPGSDKAGRSAGLYHFAAAERSDAGGTHPLRGGGTSGEACAATARSWREPATTCCLPCPPALHSGGEGLIEVGGIFRGIALDSGSSPLYRSRLPAEATN